MKYRISHYPSSEQPFQVEEDQWEMQWEPEFWVVTMTKERDSDDQLMKDIINYYNDNGVWAISNMVYFYKESDLTFFRLRWS
jgi:hypothetical protein